MGSGVSASVLLGLVALFMLREGYNYIHEAGSHAVMSMCVCVRAGE